jgi:hypothetical protein
VTNAERAIAGAIDAADAWSKLADASLLPRSWTNDERRRFRHHVREICDTCAGFAHEDCAARCTDGYLVTYAWRAVPETVSECAAYTEVHDLVARYEVLALDLVARVEPWLPSKPREPTLRWTMFSSARTSRVPGVLEPAWYALREAVPDAGLPELSVVRPAPKGWAERGQRAWRAAVARALRVPKAPWVDATSVGLVFSELPDPFARAAELQSLPFDLFRVDGTSVELWAWDPRGSGG